MRVRGLWNPLLLAEKITPVPCDLSIARAGSGTAAHYAASKGGVLGLMRNVALELAPHGIRCNAVCPGAVDTVMLNWQGAYDLFAGHEGGTRDDFVRAGHSFHALKDVGMLDPQVVADATLWLVSDQASVITGVALPIEAGHMLLTGSSNAS
jgi:NAD(P)-dependent dehydrogenase (short-subunit alcohol dehydrogenase family)